MDLWRLVVAINLGLVWYFSDCGSVVTIYIVGALCYFASPHIFKNTTGRDSSTQTDDGAEDKIFQENTDANWFENCMTVKRTKKSHPRVKRSLRQVFECAYARLVFPWYAVPEPCDCQPLHLVLWREFEFVFDQIINRAKDFDVSAASVGCIRILTQHVHDAKQSDREPLFSSREEEVAVLRVFSGALVQNLLSESLCGLDLSHCALNEIIALQVLELVVTWFSDPDMLNKLVVSQLDRGTHKRSMESSPASLSEPDGASPAPLSEPDGASLAPLCDPDAASPASPCDPDGASPDPLCDPDGASPDPLCDPASASPDPLCEPDVASPDPLCEPDRASPDPLCDPDGASLASMEDEDSRAGMSEPEDGAHEESQASGCKPNKKGNTFTKRLSKIFKKKSKKKKKQQDCDAVDGYQASSVQDDVEFKLMYDMMYEMWSVGHWAVSILHVERDCEELCFTVHLEQRDNPDNLHWDVRMTLTDVNFFMCCNGCQGALPGLRRGSEWTDERKEQTRTSVELFLQELVSDEQMCGSEPVFKFLCPLDKLMDEEAISGDAWHVLTGLTAFLTSEEDENNDRGEARPYDPSSLCSETPHPDASETVCDNSGDKTAVPLPTSSIPECGGDAVDGPWCHQMNGSKGNYQEALAKEVKQQPQPQPQKKHLGATKAIIDLLKEISGNSMYLAVFHAILAPIMPILKMKVNSFLSEMNPTEAQVATYIDKLRENQWPEGSPAASSSNAHHSSDDKIQTRDQALRLIKKYSNRFILKETDLETVFQIFQDREQNKKLIYMLLSFLLNMLLPEDEALKREELHKLNTN